MGAFGIGGEVATLCEALKKRERFISINSMYDFASILNEACKLEPRLCGCVETWSGKMSTQGLLRLNKNYQIELTYSKNTPHDINSVIIDDGKWKPSDTFAASKELPETLQIVTTDINGLRNRITEDHDAIRELYYGITTTSTEWVQDTHSGYYSLWLYFAYCVDTGKYNMMMTLAKRKVEEIDRRFLGSRDVPKIIKAFLAFSYLQQNCLYDDESAELIKTSLTANMERPWVILPYGPLVKNMGVCEGIAAAYKMFMDHYGIKCRLVMGHAGTNANTENHSWNIISISNQYFHVDATFGINGDGVYVSSFMRDDDYMSSTHTWDMKRFPECTARHPNFNYVEDYIDEHRDELDRMGVDERYLCPYSPES